jgi:hypothetical protein
VEIGISGGGSDPSSVAALHSGAKPEEAANPFLSNPR